jgi:tetratricopeptide (TPR) repeat protein
MGIAHAGRRMTIAAALALYAVGAAAQIPDKFTNLRVLPKDISRKDLVMAMRGWATALGVRCGHCHTGGNPDTLQGVDFASDAKWEKRTAREMLRMVLAVEADYLRKIEPRPVGTGERAPAPVALACITCHHGLTRPETLDAAVERVLLAEGPEAAVRTYKDLRAKYLDRGSYDFSERSMNTLAERLMQQKRNRDAALLLEASAEFNPEAGWLQHLLGEARLADGDRAGARTAFTRALALSPENDLTRKRVQELGAADEAPRP